MTYVQSKGFKYFGRLNDPDGSAYVKGVCGEEMEFYLEIENDVLSKVRFYSEGCEHTCMCADAVATKAEGKKIKQALCISPAVILKELPSLPKDHLHCSILSTITFLKAVGEYIFVRENS